MNTPDNLELAREWAEGDFDQAYIHAGPRAAAEVIAALPDEWIDVDKLRETIEFHRDRLPHGAEEDLRALLPAPDPRKTLADMTPEEQEACQFMAAEVATGRTWYIIGENPVQPGWWIVVTRSGRIETRPPEHITPLPDLPRMVWPDGHHPATDTEETPEPALPRPEDVPEEELWLVEFDGKQDVAVRELPGAERPWWLMRGWRASDKDITLMSRLVPEEQAAEETPDQPRPEDVKPDPQPGEAWLIEYEGGYYDAVYWYSPIYAHWAFVECQEKGLKTVESPEATPVSRLVPEGEQA